MKTYYTGLVIGLLLAMVVPAQAELYIDGFVQNLQGARLDEANPTATEMTASETRLQLRTEHFGDAGEFFARLDFVYDGADMDAYEWELREGYMKFRLGEYIDVKLGRQVLTWGTGDLIFINDVFAKDYRSFFVGRDDQYLKAPQDAMRFDMYPGIGSLSLVWTPQFTPNRLPTGRKLSYFNGQQIVGDGPELTVEKPQSKFENGEFAARFSRMFGSYRAALYFYKGFYKNPMGAQIIVTEDGPQPMPVYPHLNIYGVSVRGPLAGGIVWLEGGYFDSRDDQYGDDPLMPNSQAIGMGGFERQVASNLTVNGQWQAEYMVDHDEYAAPREAGGMYVRDEVRHLVTSRITKLLADELLTLSVFGFYSPTDEDSYVRLSASYKHSDELTLAVGGNLFDGKHQATEFGQFQKNDNVYLKATYGF